MRLHEIEPTGPGLRLSVGVSRSGKTHGVRQQVYRSVRAGVPVLVLDRLAEWSTLPPDIARLAVGVSPEGGLGLATAWLREGARLVILRSRDVRADAIGAARWAAEGGPSAHRGVAIPEVHRAAPNDGSRLPEAIEDAALAWAHHGVSLWCDTQRLSKLHRDLTEQMRELRVHAVGGERDLARLRELGGRELEEAARECARRLVAGEPGWYVRIATVAVPPYSLHREGG